MRALAERLEHEQPERTHSIEFAYVWGGDLQAAVRVGRRAVAARGDAALDDLRYALQAAGEYVEMEEIARRELVGASGAGLGVRRLRVDMALTAQGRVTEALRWLDSSWPYHSAEDRAGHVFRRAMIAAATGRAELVWRYALQAREVDAGWGATLAVVLFLLGDPKHAETLARGVSPESFPAQEWLALRALRAGDAEGAKAILRRLERRDPWPGVGLAPSYLLAEVSAATGDDAGTVAAVERFRRLPPDRIWRAWAYPGPATWPRSPGSGWGIGTARGGRSTGWWRCWPAPIPGSSWPARRAPFSGGWLVPETESRDFPRDAPV